MKELTKLIKKLPDYMDDIYDVDKKGDQGYIGDCQKAIREIKGFTYLMEIVHQLK